MAVRPCSPGAGSGAWGQAAGSFRGMEPAPPASEAEAEAPDFDEETGAPLNEAAAALVARAIAGGSSLEAALAEAAEPGGGATLAAGGPLAGAAAVVIAPGKWKFVAIDLRDASGATKRVVRSFAGKKFHADNFQQAMVELEPLGLRGKVIGGGRIEYDPADRTVSVYGYSKTFGRSAGCNEHAASLIEQALPECTVSWSDKGY